MDRMTPQSTMERRTCPWRCEAEASGRLAWEKGQVTHCCCEGYEQGLLAMESQVSASQILRDHSHASVDCWKHAVLLPDQLQLSAAPQEQEAPLVEESRGA